MVVLAVCAVLAFFGSASRLLGQAPTDEWRRAGVDPMVAEPAQGASLLPNPAGLRTQERRQRPEAGASARSLKQEFITEILSIGLFVDFDFVDLLGDVDEFGARVNEQLGAISSVSKLLGGSADTTNSTLKLLQDLSTNDYNQIVNGTTVLSTKTPATVTLADIQNEVAAGNIAAIANNLGAAESLVNALADSMGEVILGSFGKIGAESFSRIFGLTYSDDSRPIAWAIYFGFEQSIALRMNVDNDKVSMPVSMQINSIELETELSLALKFYLLTPLRFGLATDFDQAIPGFTFGLGLKMVPYNGFNQQSLGKFISKNVSASGINLNSTIIAEVFYSSSGLNLGADLGVQYHFGAITPKLDFLHLGLKISDLLGFNIPFYEDTDTLRYALDFDFGAYAEHNFDPKVQLFGGAELIQIRGMFDPSPFSALYEPIDHLRLLLGVALLDNLLRFSLQFYNSSFTLATMLNVGKFQLGLGVRVNAALDRAWGLDLTLRFRSPHDGFNHREAYRQYAKKKS